MQIFHVRQPETALSLIEQSLARCVVIDRPGPLTELAALTRALRQASATIGLLALYDADADDAARDTVCSLVDGCLPRDATPDQLLRAVRDLRRIVASRPPDPNAETSQPPLEELQNRMRHLEGLVHATLNLPATFEESNILDDLHHVAQIAVDADRMVILLANDDYTTLSDTLDLGVPQHYLDVCQQEFASFTRDERMMYLGDEVLLRERVPEMLPSAMRVREAAAADAWSYMRLPLMIEQRLIGFVAFFSDTPGRFNGAHLQLGRLFAAQVSTAVRNMRLAFRLRRAEQRQQAVAQVARLIAEDLTLNTVLTRIVEEAVRLVQGRSGTVLLVQPDGSLAVSAVSGADKSTLGTRIDNGHGQTGMVALTGQPSIVTHLSEGEPAALDTPRTGATGDTLLAVPLIYRGHVLGVLQVLATRDTLRDIQEEQDVLVMLAPQAATAIAKAQLHETVRQDQQQMRAILDHTAAAVAVFGTDGRLMLANPEAQRLFNRVGVDVNEARRRSFIDLVADRLPPDLKDMTRLHLVEINLGEAGEYLLHIASVQRSDGSVERYVCVGQDVSQLRRIERMKTDMIHILSHDLRNPLGLARGSIELLNEPDVGEEQRAQLWGMVINSMDRMDQLIQDVVDLEQAESLGHQSAVPYDLAALVEKVLKRNRGKAESQKVALEYHEARKPEHHLRGHAVMVGQAIDNLVSNAIKYTPAGGEVHVTLTVEGANAVVRVKDNGYGIPKEHLPHLFRQFYRVYDRRTRHIQGTGLGLSLVRAIAQAHGGRVTVESEIDVGSTFALYLPLKTPPAEEGTSSQIVRLDFSNLASSANSETS